MKLDPAVFYNYSLAEWILAQRGFFELEEMRMRGEWERQRWSSFWVVKSQTGKKWPFKVTDLVKFGWEKEESTDDWVMTDEEMDYMARKMGKYTDKEGNSFNA